MGTNRFGISKSSKHHLVTEKEIVPIEDLFPLPKKPPEMCHDEFIKILLAPYEVVDKKHESKVEVLESSSSEIDDPINYVAKMYQVNYQALTTKYMARATSVAAQFRILPDGGRSRSTLSQIQRASAIKTHQMFQTRFRNLISDFREVCVEFQLLQLLEILNVMREFPPEGTDPNDTIFVWCYKELLKRFDQQGNTVYVDLLEMNKSEDTLDDLKFYVDLSEIIRLVKALLSDVAADRDLCSADAFMELLSNTTKDVVKLIAEPNEKVMAEHDAFVEEVAIKGRSGTIQNPRLVAKQRALKKDDFQINYVLPIESRCKLNTIYDRHDQAKYIDFLHCKKYKDELDKLKQLTVKDRHVWKSVNDQYCRLIEHYKDQINITQQAYDDDMDTADADLQRTIGMLTKCKEELKARMDMVAMFKKKVKRVLEEEKAKAEEEKAKQDRLSLARPSKRLSPQIQDKKPIVSKGKKKS
ncbi:hypothetical protein KR009_002756 [Drosophila setifemur]|nr:hypothetical protein KR009_002756 [Drosophila setifemur]